MNAERRFSSFPKEGFVRDVLARFEEVRSERSLLLKILRSYVAAYPAYAELIESKIGRATPKSNPPPTPTP